MSLIAETETAIAAADEVAEAEREKALDPALSPDPKAAREAIQAAELARDRLRTLLSRFVDPFDHQSSPGKSAKSSVRSIVPSQ